MMRYALIALLMLCGSAGAESQFGANDRPRWDPPARYDHPYKGTLIEHRLPQQAVRRYCSDLNVAFFGEPKEWGQHTRGCSYWKGNTCVIVYIDRRYGLAAPEAVRRHEIGHCNGWPVGHPN